MKYKTISVSPVSPVIGAEIEGVDLTRPVAHDVIKEIRTALTDHLVVFFRDQPIEIQAQKAFGKQFGQLHIHPGAMLGGGDPEVIRIHADATSKGVAGEKWHSDLSCDETPPMGSILAMHTLPTLGGDTVFASAYAAYEALSAPMKAYLEPLTATHDGERVFRKAYAGRQGAKEATYPKASHPIIVTHPESGRKLLFVNPEFTSHIDGIGAMESNAVLEYLYQHFDDPRFSTRFRWRPHSIAFWDNRCAQHIAVWDYFPQTRSGVRVTIAGEAPRASR